MLLASAADENELCARMIEPYGRIDLQEATIAEAALQNGRERSRQRDVCFEVVEELALQIGRFLETPGERIGARDCEDVVRVAFDDRSMRDRIVCRDAIDAPPQMGMSIVDREVVVADGEPLRRREMSESERLRAVHLRIESGAHVLRREDEVDESPEAISSRRARQSFATDRDRAFEPMTLR